MSSRQSSVVGRQSDGLRPLPEGWVWTMLQEVAKINGRDPEIRDLPDDLPVNFVPMAAVDAMSGTIARPEVRPLKEVRKGFTPFSDGDVIIAKITPSMENGKAAIARNLVNGRGFGSTEFHVFRPKEGLLPEFLFHFIRQESFRKDAKAHFAGTAGQLRVPASFFYYYPIPLPPLPEQERIVARLEELLSDLEAGVAALERVRLGVKRFKASVLKAAFTGRLFGDRPDGLPEGWVWTTIGQITLPIEKVRPEDKLDVPFVYIDISSIDNSIQRIIEPKEYLGVDAPSRARQLVHSNDIVFSTVRTYLKNIALVPEKYDGQVASTGFSILRASDAILPNFLFYYTLTDEFLSPLNELQRGTSYPAIRDGDVRVQPVPLPPLEEQRRIVAEVERRLESARAVESAVEVGLKRAERLRQAVLRSAFEGRL